MAVVQGIREKVHLPLYDSLSVEAEKQLREAESSSTLKFFVNVQGKTKLETNLQSASLLPHYNTFEARAMRVVISDLPPEFPDDIVLSDEDFPVVDDNEDQIVVDGDGTVVDPDTQITDGGPPPLFSVFADFEFGLDRIMELLAEARESADRIAFIDVDEDGVTLKALADDGTEQDIDPDTLLANVLDDDGTIEISVGDLEKLIADLDERTQPP